LALSFLDLPLRPQVYRAQLVNNEHFAKFKRMQSDIHMPTRPFLEVGEGRYDRDLLDGNGR
jgi:hypothetical protein